MFGRAPALAREPPDEALAPRGQGVDLVSAGHEADHPGIVQGRHGAGHVELRDLVVPQGMTPGTARIW